MRVAKSLLGRSGVVLLGLCSLVASGQTPSSADSTLRVEVSGLRNEQGDVGCLLFSRADGYPESYEKALKEVHVAIKGSSVVCAFSPLAPGTYAVIVLHDENLNGKMDKNLLGIPREGYGASNNVRHAFTPPKFDEASFAVAAGQPKTIQIEIRY
jgi:uncharacterized protein (DUF2141 family)